MTEIISSLDSSHVPTKLLNLRSFCITNLSTLALTLSALGVSILIWTGIALVL